MIKVFNRDNLAEVINKKPIICYHSENGACGPSGLFFVIFSDRSLYAYSTLYEKSDISLIKEIIEHVPELRCLLFLETEFHYKRERIIDTFESVYLGLGNEALILEELVDKLEEYEGDYLITRFRNLVSEYIDGDYSKVFDMVRKAING